MKMIMCQFAAKYLLIGQKKHEALYIVQHLGMLHLLGLHISYIFIICLSSFVAQTHLKTSHFSKFMLIAQLHIFFV